MIDNQIVYAVIPTFNRRNMLKECIDSLLSQSRPLNRIIVINSGSTDGTSVMLSKYNGCVHVIDGHQGWWWAKCMNVGITYSLENGSDYILAMNDDTILENNGLEYLLETSRLFPGNIIGGIVKDNVNNLRMINNGFGAKYTKYRWIPFEKIVANINGRDIYYTEGHSGRGVLFPVSVYDKIGLYDIENFPHRGDRDFSFRCYREGIGQNYDSGVTVLLNFKTSYLNVESKRFKIADVKNALFHTNGLYNIKHQYRFLRKHYYYMWLLWFSIWIIYVHIICLIRMLPGGSKLMRNIINKVVNASNC